MKKVFFSLAMMFASISLTATAADCQVSDVNDCAEVAIIDGVDGFNYEKFAGIVLEQTLTFDNGKTAVVYYKLEDGKIAIYSETDLSRYSLDDLLKLKESKERKVSAVKGKRYGKYSISEAKRIAAKWLGI